MEAHMKRLLLSLVLVFAVLFAGCTKKEEATGTAAAPAAESKELVVYSPNVDSIINTIIPMFEEETGIKVTVISAGSGEITKRIDSELENPYADVNFGGFVVNPDHYEPYAATGLENLAINQETRLPFATPYLANGSCLLVNKNLIGDIVIEGYDDLLNPALKGKIASGDPMSSSSAYFQLTNMLLAHGGYESEEAWDYVEKLVANMEGKIFSSSGAVHRSVADGEFTVALTYDDPSANYVRNGAPVYVVWPKEGAVFHASDLGIIKGAKNMENAKKFADFLISKKAQDAFGTVLTNVPFHKDATVGDHITAISSIKTLNESRPEVEAKKEQILARWMDILTQYGE
jgi:iron(III) transport system substrate-binding protein